MLFPTPIFGLFLAIVVLGATALSTRLRIHHAFLLVASYVFYGAWDPRFLLLIVFSTVLDYVVGLGIQGSDRPRRRRWLLVASLVGNLGVLGMFKYHDFFAENLNALLVWAGFEPSLPVLNLILPVGISFYTFQTLSYTIDIYRGKLEARRNILDVALFVAFFPQLVAGPIVRAREFLPQLDSKPKYDSDRTGSGIYLILKGLTKKVVFADLLGSFLVNPAYSDPEAHAGLWVLLAFVGFRFQIYGDFSGYTDVAIGCGRLLGFELPENFRSPYKAAAFSDYWRRWHMTLGSWFRDYVFFPLGGSRGTLWRVSLNILLTMTLVGLWHGAAWTFVVWGLMQGVFLVCERVYRTRWQGDRPPTRWLHPFKVVFIFAIGTLAASVFRAPDMRTWVEMLEALWKPTTSLAPIPVVAWVAFSLAVLTHYLPQNWKERSEIVFSRLPAAAQALLAVLLLLTFRIVGTVIEPFYYFQF